MTPMSSMIHGWLTRERGFAAFTTGPLLDFWQRRREGEFCGVDGVAIRYVAFCDARHTRAILIAPGRIESYMKYPELAYDLFVSGYDVVIIDHRGQGTSERMLADSHRGHVERFDDYVDDLQQLWQRELLARPYRQRFLLAHSMGGAISALFLARRPAGLTAAALCAPMTGIRLPLPRWLANGILSWAARRRARRTRYALGTGYWRPLPFMVNELTHSRVRYRRFLRYYSDYPQLQVGGPTYQWVAESLAAAERIQRVAPEIVTPLLLLQAAEDRVVDNASQLRFCQTLAAAGNAPWGGAPLVIKGARHEILFERDSQRAEALTAIVRFFKQFSESPAPIAANPC
ncbi:lysophospholipase L2 [Edwardsiella piscicida]